MFDAYEADRAYQRQEVAGALGTARIALNDNLLNNTSLPEIRAVMAHGLGHYVLYDHVWRQVIYLDWSR